MNKSFYLSLRTQYENLGDYLIAQAMLDLLAMFGNIIIDIRDVPDSYLALFTFPENTKLVKQGFISTLLTFPKSTKYIYVVKPGGYGHAKSYKHKIRFLFMGLYFSVAKKIGNVKLIKMPHSFNGPLTWEEKFYHNLFDLTLCRDKSTLLAYETLSTATSARLFPDLAMYYIARNSKFLSDTVPQKDTIAVSLRYDRKNDEADVALNIAKKLSSAENIHKIIFVSQVKFDIDLNDSIAQSEHKDHVVYEIDNISIQKISQVYKQSKYILSNRLHALLLGLINGAIPIAIIDPAKDQKILSCLEFLHIPWLEKKHLENRNLPVFDQNYVFDFHQALQTMLADL